MSKKQTPHSKRKVSCFSPVTLVERHHRALLLQCLLSDLFAIDTSDGADRHWECILSSAEPFFPYDFGKQLGYLNAIQEHGVLLPQSFPDAPAAVQRFNKKLTEVMRQWAKHKSMTLALLKKGLKQLYLTLEPLLFLCHENENLLLFLLQHRDAIDGMVSKGHLLTFLHKLAPEGIEMLGEKLSSRYDERGFVLQSQELKVLLSKLM